MILLSPYEKKFLNAMTNVPIREELRYNIAKISADAIDNEKLKVVLNTIGNSELGAVVAAQLGYSMNSIVYHSDWPT